MLDIMLQNRGDLPGTGTGTEFEITVRINIERIYIDTQSERDGSKPT